MRNNFILSLTVLVYRLLRQLGAPVYYICAFLALSSNIYIIGISSLGQKRKIIPFLFLY